MIDIEATILAIISDGGGHELAIWQASDGVIIARTTAIHARHLHKTAQDESLSVALQDVARRMGVEAPLALDPTLCEHCGLPLEPHPECRPEVQA